MNGYDDIAANDESANNFYIFCFASVPYTPQEDVERDKNKLSSGDLVCNAIYKTSTLEIPPGLHYYFSNLLLLHQWIALEVYFMMIQVRVDSYW